MHIVEDEVFIAKPLSEVFAFFSNPENLNKITPKFTQFTIITKLPITMGINTTIDYRIKFRGIPMRWRSEFTVWDPPHQFQDIQTKGPFAIWEHTHTFIEQDGGVVMKDTLRYKPIGWILERIINKLFVQRDVKKIFAYRKDNLQKIVKLMEEPAK